MKAKFFTLFLALLTSAGTIFAESGTCGENLTWDLTNGVLTISGTGAMSDFSWRSSPWYSYSTNIASVTIGNSVTSIGEYAFYGCSGLTNVTIPNSVTSIGWRAFYNCTGLTNVTIGNSVTSIGENAFSGCSGLTNVTIPNSVISIGDYAFWNCSGLTSIEIPNSVTSIGEWAFLGCIGLISVTIGNSVTSIGGAAFSSCTGLTSVTIGNSVTSIGWRAFENCTGLTSVTIPNSVTSIGGAAFENCTGLTSIVVDNANTKYDSRDNCNAIIEKSSNTLMVGCKNTIIPNSVTSIGWQAFLNCTGLTNVTIPNSVTSIGDWAFENCTGLTSVTIPNSVTSIGYGTFYNCSGLTSVTIPNSVTSIGENVFSGCSGLTNVTIPNSVDSIGWRAFENCTGLTSVTIGNSVTSIGEYAFSGCSGLTNVTIPNSVTSIGEHAFFGCSGLTNVTIPNSVTSIGENAFSGCSGLTNVTIPNSVDSIGSYAFYNCSGLTTLCLYAEVPPSCEYSVFYGTNLSNIYVCGSGTLEAYQAADGWSQYASLLKQDEGNPHLHLAININDAGTVSHSQDLTLCSDSTTIEATANYGYHFVRWNDGVTTNPRRIDLIPCKDTTFTAEFAKNTYTISTGSANPQWGTTDGDTTALYLEEVPISATPNYGYHFVRWNDGNNSNPRTITMTENKTYQAIFAKNVYSITKVSTSTQGSISGLSQAEYLDNVTLSASPNYGYHFTQWSDGNTDNPRTFVLRQDTTFTAEFAKNGYTITTESSNNEWGTTAGDTTALYLDDIQISATANYGYTFAGWNDGNNSNPRTITVTENKTYYAVFEKNLYSITKQCNSEQGYIDGNSYAEYLDEVTLTAIPNYSYRFAQWSDGIKDNPRTFVLTQDTTFTAEFELCNSGQCGDNLYWSYSDGVLSITGFGDMYNYTENTIPWDWFIAEIKTVVFADEMTSIGDYACANITKLEQINIPAKVQTIGNYAFANINNRKINNLVLPSEIISIGDYAFAGNTYIEQIDFGKNLETIGAYAFQSCTRVITMTCLAEITPDVETGALASIKDQADLYVLATVLKKYQVDDNWSRFLLHALGAEGTTVSDNQVTVETTDNTATMTWPTDDNAASYTIQITKDGVVFCTLIFNGNGQLTGIAFAPSKDGSHNSPAATLTANGMQFTVTGLNSATHYAFTLQTKDDQETVLASYTGEFTTTGEAQVPTGINQTANDQLPTTNKVFRDGQIFILRGDKTYTITGQEVN